MKSPDSSLVEGLAERYRIGEAVGEGGMATVYEAEDLRHGRRVAIKVLRPELGAVLGTERFLKEIEVTANLHHPHILGLIDSGAIDGTLFYVMPFMEGESLRGRLDRERQLPVDDAVRIASEIAAAVGYAHRQGVVHRDIKPENILLHDGHAMVADFGIALAVSEAAGPRLTATGLSMGTPQYMSPEQASGDAPVDRRADIYAIGCVLYEMLTGEAPFQGRTARAVMSAIIASEPTPVGETRTTVPPHIEAAVHTALEKIPADRFQEIRELTEALKGQTERTSARVSGAQRQRRAPTSRLSVGVALAALVVGVLLGRVFFGGTAVNESSAIRHLDLNLPEDIPVALTGPGAQGFWQPAVALHPSGELLAYVAPLGETTVLALRPLDSDTARVVPGTEGAYHPFFSPDGEWIGFFSDNELLKVPSGGGSAVTLTTVDRPSGAVWLDSEEIVLFQQDGFEMRRVPASGGQGTSVVLPAQFGSPDVLPGGHAVVGHYGSGQLALLTFADTTLNAITRRGVIPLDSVRLDDLLIGASPKFVRSGHIVFGGEDGQLFALPFDHETLEPRGGAVPVADGVRIEEGYGFTQYDIGPDGTLVYVPGASQLFGEIAFLNPDGSLDTVPLPRGQYTQPRLSPDGRRLAVQQRMPVGGWDIVVLDLETGIARRLPFEGDFKVFPASWTSDGNAMLVGFFNPAANSFVSASVYNFSNAEWTPIDEPIGSYMTVGPEGDRVVYSDFRTGELHVRPLFGEGESFTVPAYGFAASFSPDGRWLAWGGTDGGVAVSPLPPTGAVYPVAERGQMPLWMPDGSGLLFRDGRQIFEARVDLTRGPAGFSAQRPRLVAEGSFLRTLGWNHTLGPDGRLAVIVSNAGDVTRELGVITGFDLQLIRRAPPLSEP